MCQTAQAQSTIYKCVVKGKTLYSESPCRANAYNENVFEVNNERIGNVYPDRETIEATRARIREEMVAPVQGAGGSTTTTRTTTTTTFGSKNYFCNGIDEELKNLDSRSRQPISGWEQDQIRLQKSDAHKRKSQYGCV